MNKIICNDCDTEIQSVFCPSCDEKKNKKNVKLNTSLDIIIAAILIVSGLGIGLVFILYFQYLGWGSVFISFYLTAVFYFFMGGISSDTSVFTKWFKVGGTVAAFIIILWSINKYIDPELTQDNILTLKRQIKESIQKDKAIIYEVRNGGKVIGELNPSDFKEAKLVTESFLKNSVKNFKLLKKSIGNMDSNVLDERPIQLFFNNQNPVSFNISELFKEKDVKNSILDSVNIHITDYKNFDEYEYTPLKNNRSIPDPKRIKTLKFSGYSIKYIEKNKLGIFLKNKKEPIEVSDNFGTTRLFFPDGNRRKPHILIVRNHYPAQYRINDSNKNLIINNLEDILVNHEKFSSYSKRRKKANKELLNEVKRIIKKMNAERIMKEDILKERFTEFLNNEQLKECMPTILRGAKIKPDRINLLILLMELNKA